jgi:ketosteroid isomerase-like protein
MTISLDLHPTISAFLAAHTRRDADAAIRSFTPDAVVVDDGSTYRGAAEVLDFLHGGGSEFTYTTELVAAQRVDDEYWTAKNHLEGDFPGGVVDLVYRFTLRGDLISALTIAP